MTPQRGYWGLKPQDTCTCMHIIHWKVVVHVHVPVYCETLDVDIHVHVHVQCRSWLATQNTMHSVTVACTVRANGHVHVYSTCLDCTLHVL